MHYNEHNPPHFHAKYGDYQVLVEIDSGIVSGTFPKYALRAVLEWLDLYKKELLKDWQLAQKGLALSKIKPLE